jgi:hypothetical protein
VAVQIHRVSQLGALGICRLACEQPLQLPFETAAMCGNGGVGEIRPAAADRTRVLEQRLSRCPRSATYMTASLLSMGCYRQGLISSTEAVELSTVIDTLRQSFEADDLEERRFGGKTIWRKESRNSKRSKPTALCRSVQETRRIFRINGV